jgi:magnesium transporter
MKPPIEHLQKGAAEVADALGRLGRRLGTVFGLPENEDAAHTRPTRAAPGSTPGIESIADVDKPPPAGTVSIQCMDYGPESVTTRVVEDLQAFLAEPRPAAGAVRWLNVDGLHPYVVDQFRRRYGLHTLAAEDVLRTRQRPKIESFDDHLFIVVRMLMLRDQHLVHEQVSLFLFKDMVITFQESEGDVWDPIRQRIQKPTSRLRNLDASYLLYALLDAVVDHCFPILETYGELLEEMEHEVLADPSPSVQQRLHGIKRELGLLRRVIWPMREVVNELHRDDTEEISPAVKAYMRDVYDHAVQVMDIVETYREMAGGLNDLYMSAVGNRMNEIMKVLTIMASFFIPITFVAGVYGMNFEHIPELGWKYSYPIFWLVCLSIVGGLLFYFYRKGWLGRK